METVKFSLRIPTNLHSDLKDLADKDMRSLNMYILKILENHVNDVPKRDPNIRTATKREDAYHIDINLPDK